MIRAIGLTAMVLSAVAAADTTVTYLAPGVYLSESRRVPNLGEGTLYLASGGNILLRSSPLAVLPGEVVEVFWNGSMWTPGASDGASPCLPASATDGGCLTADTQSIAGNKFFTGYIAIDGGLSIGNGVREDWDGGTMPGAAQASYFVAYKQFHGMGADGLLLTDGGAPVGSFNCKGVGGDGHGNGQPCLTNPEGIVEIYGRAVGTSEYQEDYSQTGNLCPVELYDIGPDLTRDGGINNNAMVCMGKYGAGDKLFRFYRDGSFKMDGTTLSIAGPRAIIQALAATGPAGLEVYGRTNSGGGRGRAGVYVANLVALGATDDSFQVLDSSGLWVASITAQGAVRFGLVVTGAEPTCPGASNLNLGQVHYNTTVQKLRVCTSGGWETVTSAP